MNQLVIRVHIMRSRGCLGLPCALGPLRQLICCEAWWVTSAVSRGAASPHAGPTSYIQDCLCNKGCKRLCALRAFPSVVVACRANAPARAPPWPWTPYVREPLSWRRRRPSGRACWKPCDLSGLGVEWGCCGDPARLQAVFVCVQAAGLPSASPSPGWPDLDRFLGCSNNRSSLAVWAYLCVGQSDISHVPRHAATAAQSMTSTAADQPPSSSPLKATRRLPKAVTAAEFFDVNSLKRVRPQAESDQDSSSPPARLRQRHSLQAAALNPLHAPYRTFKTQQAAFDFLDKQSCRRILRYGGPYKKKQHPKEPGTLPLAARLLPSAATATVSKQGEVAQGVVCKHLHMLHATCRTFATETAASGQREFIVTSAQLFWDKYTQLPAQQRHCYEIIRQATPCNLYFGEPAALHCACVVTSSQHTALGTGWRCSVGGMQERPAAVASPTLPCQQASGSDPHPVRCAVLCCLCCPQTQIWSSARSATRAWTGPAWCSCWCQVGSKLLF